LTLLRQAKERAWSALLASYCGKELLPSITRSQFGAALKTGFDYGWEAKDLSCLTPLSVQCQHPQLI